MQIAFRRESYKSLTIFTKLKTKLFYGCSNVSVGIGTGGLMQFNVSQVS